MHCAKSNRRRSFGFIAMTIAGLVASGCGISLNHVALPLAPQDAPKAWQPLLDCSKELGFRNLDMTKDANTPRVVVYTTDNDMMEIDYKTREGHFEMELEIWAKTSDDDREKIFAKMRSQGDQIWACAQQKMNARPVASAPPAASATPPP